MSYNLFKLLSTGCFQDELPNSNLFSIIGDFIDNKSILYKDVFIEDKNTFNYIDAICNVYLEYKWIFIAYPTFYGEIYEILGVGINKDGNYKIIDDEEDLYESDQYEFWIDFLTENIDYAQDVIDPIKYVLNNKADCDHFCDKIRKLKY